MSVLDTCRLNEGIALLGITLQDNGGTLNGGDDTSEIFEFLVINSDLIFSNGFE